MNKSHVYCRTPYGFQLSPYLQQITVYVGQACVFEEGEQMLKELVGVDVNAKQIERLTHGYGELLETQQGQQED